MRSLGKIEKGAKSVRRMPNPKKYPEIAFYALASKSVQALRFRKRNLSVECVFIADISNRVICFFVQHCSIFYCYWR